MREKNEKLNKNNSNYGAGIEHHFYINPLTDFGIKRIFFMTRRGPDRLICFLQAFLPDIMRDVVSITFKPTELFGERESEKRVVFDIYCVTNTDKHFIIEMQRSKQSFFQNRIITYDSRVVSSEVERGDMKYNIPTVISFNIMDYDSDEFVHSEKAFHIVKLKDDENVVYSEKKVFCFLELSKFAAQNIGQLKNINFLDDKQKWAFILKNMHQMNEQDLSDEDEIFRGLFEDCRFSKLTKMEKKKYKKSLMDYYDVRDAMNVALEDGRKLGYEQGIKEGREEGREKGREEGREEGRTNEKYQLTLNMLEEGLDTTMVARITGLPEVEILKLMQR